MAPVSVNSTFTEQEIIVLKEFVTRVVLVLAWEVVQILFARQHYTVHTQRVLKGIFCAVVQTIIGEIILPRIPFMQDLPKILQGFLYGLINQIAVLVIFGNQNRPIRLNFIIKEILKEFSLAIWMAIWNLPNTTLTIAQIQIGFGKVIGRVIMNALVYGIASRLSARGWRFLEPGDEANGVN